MELGEMLLAARAVTADEVSRGLERARAIGQRLGSALVALRVLQPDQVAAALAAQHDVMPVRDVDLRMIPHALAALVPAELAHELCALPLWRCGGALVMAMRDPHDTAALAALAVTAGMPVRAAVACEARLRQAIEGVYATRPSLRERIPVPAIAVPGAQRRGHLRRPAASTPPPIAASPVVQPAGRFDDSDGLAPVARPRRRASTLPRLTTRGPGS